MGYNDQLLAAGNARILRQGVETRWDALTPVIGKSRYCHRPILHKGARRAPTAASPGSAMPYVETLHASSLHFAGPGRQTSAAINIFFSLANGVITNYAYDAAGRLDVLEAKKGATTLFKQDYGYDNTGNITSINDGTNDWKYDYDRSNQLIRSEMPVAEAEDSPTPGAVPGHIYEDYGGKQPLDFTRDPNVGIFIDIRASSIGLDFGQEAPGIKVIRLVPDAAHQTNRLHAKALALYVSDDNITYAPLQNGEWSFAKDQAGVATITLNQKKPARYLKIHVKFDDRLATFLPAEDKAQFFNALAGMIEVQSFPSRA